MRTTTIVTRDQDGRPDGVAVNAWCAACGVMFEFAGIESSATVLVSDDRTEVRLLIVDSEAKKGAPETEAPTPCPEI